MKVLYSPKAQNNLVDIRDYIESELLNPTASKRVIAEITKNIRTLENFPVIGASLSSVIDMETEYRFLVCGNYLAFYRVEGNNVFIDRIMYDKRDYISILFGKRISP